MAVTVSTLSCVTVFDGVTLDPIVLEARGQVSADGGWPTCSVFLTEYPTTTPGTPGGTRIDEENDLSVVAGAGNNVTRFVGRVRRFRTSAFPQGIEMVGMGTLAYAAEWAPDEDILFEDAYPSGATDQDLVKAALDLVPQIGSGGYTGGDIDGTSITLGTEAPEAFDWKAGTSAWSYIQALDRATLFRTYQTRDGSIKRVQMIGHPNTSDDFTLAAADVLEGSTGVRDTERTRNAVLVSGYDYGGDPTLGASYGSFGPYDGSDPAERFPEVFSSPLIEDGNDDGGSPKGLGGIDAQDIADAILPDVLKEFVEAEVQSWRDDTHGPGMTCLLDMLTPMSIGESMWVMRYSWQIGDGWFSTYGLTGGGVEQTYTTPEV